MAVLQREKPIAVNPNQSISHRSSPRERYFVFLLCLVIFLTIGFWTSRYLYVFSEEAINAAWLSKILGFGRFPLSTNSHIFLLPIPIILQLPLMSIPIFWPDVSAGLVISALSAAFLGVLLFQFARVIGMSAPLRWLLLFAFITNPFILVESVSGSPTMLLMCLFFLLLIFAFKWLKIHSWFALVILGITAALAVLSRFNALVLVIIPLILVGVSSLWEKPDQPEYAENAIWIVATPVLYIILVRFFFSDFLTGNLLSFSNYDAQLPLTLNLPSSLTNLGNLRFLGEILAAFIKQINYVFFPAFPIIILLIIISALNFNWNNILFLAFCCLPVVLAYSDTETNLNSYLLFIIPACFFMLIITLDLLKRGRAVVAFTAAILILAFNIHQTQLILKSTNPSDQQTFISSWLYGSPSGNYTNAVEMADFINQHDFNPIIMLDQEAGHVVAFSAEPNNFISPLDEDYQTTLSDLKNYQGYLLLSATQPSDFIKMITGLSLLTSNVIENQAGNFFLISVMPVDSQ